MEKSTEKLLKKMNEDKEFAENILSQTEREKVIELAKEEGIELTLDNIDEVNEIIKKAIENFHDGELSEEELENVSGGGFSLIISAMVTANIIIPVASASVIASAAALSAVVSGASITALDAYDSYERKKNRENYYKNR